MYVCVCVCVCVCVRARVRARYICACGDVQLAILCVGTEEVGRVIAHT